MLWKMSSACNSSAILLQSPERCTHLLITSKHPERKPEPTPPAHLPAELRAWHSCSETLPLPGGLARACTSGKAFSAHYFSLLWSKWLCEGVSRAGTSCCSPLPHILSVYDSMSKHSSVAVSMEALGRCMQTCLGKLHSYYLSDF